MSDHMLIDDPGESAWVSLLLAHGAGAPMDSDYMQRLAQAMAERGIRVLRFEFPYMAQRRRTGLKRPPDPMPVLQAHYLKLIKAQPAPLFIGGKSMGGRVASLVADAGSVTGVLCFGYPFHPPGRPERTRIDHLQTIDTPVTVLQGTRDPFGKPGEVAAYELGQNIEVVWLESGDHDFKPLKRSGRTQQQLIELAAEAAAAAMRRALG